MIGIKPFSALGRLLFPRECVVCETELLPQERVMCTGCLKDMPLTNYTQVTDNGVELALLGRVPFVRACSLMYFRDVSPYRELLHTFKYEGRTDVGRFLSKLLAQEMKCSPYYSEIDYVVPVPLHITKLFKRGYNQSAIIAKVLARELGADYAPWLLKRRYRSSTQTKKDRLHRYLSVSQMYETPLSKAVKELSMVQKINILIVDDVITTGATIESCVMAILKALPNAKIYFASLAYVE